jgi:diacylglycerol O-acyltransferase
MAPLDAAMLTAELLGNPMHVGVVLLLTPPADAGPDYVDRLYDDAVTAGVEVDARLMRRPHRGLDTAGLWAWREVDDLDVTAHVHRRTLESGSTDELWSLVSHLHEQPLPRERPMWEAALVDGLADGRFAFYAKIHHAVVDGVTGFRMIEESLSRDPDERDMAPFFGTRRGPAAKDSTGPRLPGPVALAGATARTALGAADLGRRVVAGQVGAVVEGLTRDTTVLPFRAPRTRLNAPLGPGRAFAASAWDLDRLRRVQQAAGDQIGEVTGNDVVTAMIAGALRSWLADHAELPDDSLVAICPVSVRVPGDASETGTGGNAFGTAVCNLGTALAEPLERLDVIHRSMASAKGRVLELGSVPSLLTAAPSILPTILLPMLPFDPGLRPGYNLPISNVPGPREPLHWNGARVDAIHPVSVVYDGMALNVTVCRYADTMCFGYVAGSEAVPDVDVLAQHTEDALTELEQALGLGPPLR